MVRFIGSVDLPGICLKYYVFGNQKDGYGIRILKDKGECADQYISRNLTKVMNLAWSLRRCSVFPYNLTEVLEDLLFEAAAVDK